MIRTLEFTESVTLVTSECSECHILFAIPKDLDQRARQSKEVVFHCPNGHAQVYIETEVQRLKRERDEALRLLTQANSARDSFRQAAERERKERERIQKRVANGVCPCCHRTFKQLARHMEHKHPEYIEEHK